MKGKLPILIVFVLLIIQSSCNKEISTIAFYNVENLFDTLDDSQINDEEFLPDSEKEWNSLKYRNKLDSLAKVIALLGDNGPLVLGLCEIENVSVLEDLRKNEALKSSNYKIAHIDSRDYRGIDVALFYKPDLEMDTMEILSVSLEDDPDFRTRDVLHVILINKKKIKTHYYVNHWPSRSGGQEASDHKRMAASNTLKASIEEVLNKDSDANIIVMGDFNDETTDPSLQNLNSILFTTFASLDSASKGSYCYRDDWNMLDQILISKALQNGKSPDYIDGSAFIFEKEWMKQKGEDNRYKGYPLRTWGGKLYLGGFSDHLPVSIQIK